MCVKLTFEQFSFITSDSKVPTVVGKGSPTSICHGPSAPRGLFERHFLTKTNALMLLRMCLRNKYHNQQHSLRDMYYYAYQLIRLYSSHIPLPFLSHL